MSIIWKVVVIVALVVAVAAVLVVKRSEDRDVAIINAGSATAEPSPEPSSVHAGDVANEAKALPRLVDVGAGTCIQCKMMMPVLAELREEYAGSLRVEYYDVRKDPNLVSKYNVRVIPLQIFYDASGNELYRHESFFPKEDIVAKWKELGIDLVKAP